MSKCIDCGKRKAQEGKTMCRKCEDWHRVEAFFRARDRAAEPFDGSGLEEVNGEDAR